ncbi:MULTISPECIES: WecB/TagA/CpsF family glycosyltransferase [Burkholderia]|uniref:UDP-N-acetyl-D-mannosamine transferase n=1 Tax=Burkholderia lata (strain ATCC 17760 / DSM 23089 / LMG 22485 / NCIMB 9086 / R18194 / 383) TaxID=482957 RepID=A0A6P2JLE7_BURL3|nr:MULTISPECIES: WecB/TagA/CpsF family glycosyltransferase [Burkholderia]MBN3794331.1 WecB/TagA/CpsF family glycosyltransferase [Burkholderia sp. Ac-20392]VWB44975.1 UDP-N-acetyl-D-mannosamine transferase [Burkholderia lata]
MKRAEFLSCPIDLMSMNDTVDWIGTRVEQRQFTQHVVVNVAKIVNLQRDTELAASVRECDIVNVDGMGVVWGARLLGIPVPERVAGVDLFDRLLALADMKGLPVYLLGAMPEVVERVVEVAAARYPRLPIAGYHHGYFRDDEQAVVDDIHRSGARLLFVAITSPYKENFINRWKSELGVDFVMGVGGTFDVVAGKVARAPLWMQRSGLEWAFRVIQEPGRMWKRYLSTNSRFLAMLACAYVSRLFRRKGAVNA